MLRMSNAQKSWKFALVLFLSIAAHSRAKQRRCVTGVLHPQTQIQILGAFSRRYSLPFNPCGAGHMVLSENHKFVIIPNHGIFIHSFPPQPTLSQQSAIHWCTHAYFLYILSAYLSFSYPDFIFFLSFHKPYLSNLKHWVEGIISIANEEMTSPAQR